VARIDGVQQADAGMKVKLVYWLMRKGMAKMTGRAPAGENSGIEPIEIWAHQPKMLGGMASSSRPCAARTRSTSVSRTSSS